MPRLSSKPKQNTVPDGVHVAGVDDSGNVVLYLADKVGSKTFEITLSVGGGFSAGDTLIGYKAGRDFDLPEDLIGSQGAVHAGSNKTFDVSVQKNGTEIGIIGVVDNVISYSFGAAVSFSTGDELTFVIDRAVSFNALNLTMLATRPA